MFLQQAQSIILAFHQRQYHDLSLDVLRSLHLCVCKAYGIAVWWAVITADVWDSGATNQDELAQLSCVRCNHDIFDGYRTQKRLHPEQPLQELQDLRPSMLGKTTKHALSTKAAETGTLLGFCFDLVRRHGARLGEQGPFLLAVGEALVSARRVMAQCGPVMSMGECHQLCDHARRAFALRADAGIPFTPKWHLFLHICHRAYWNGNPRSYSTFVDEGFNGRLAAIVATCHRRTWHRRVLAGFRVAYTQQAKRAKRG